MKFNDLKILWIFSIAMATAQVMGQDVLRENNQSKFGPFMYKQGSAYRTASGKPGPQY